MALNNFLDCSQFQHKCNEGRCITRDWLCDGIKDCPNGDDEETSCGRYFYFVNVCYFCVSKFKIG